MTFCQHGYYALYNSGSIPSHLHHSCDIVEPSPKYLANKTQFMFLEFHAFDWLFLMLRTIHKYRLLFFSSVPSITSPRALSAFRAVRSTRYPSSPLSLSASIPRLPLPLRCSLTIARYFLRYLLGFRE